MQVIYFVQVVSGAYRNENGKNVGTEVSRKLVRSCKVPWLDQPSNRSPEEFSSRTQPYLARPYGQIWLVTQSMDLWCQVKYISRFDPKFCLISESHHPEIPKFQQFFSPKKPLTGPSSPPLPLPPLKTESPPSLNPFQFHQATMPSFHLTTIFNNFKHNATKFLQQLPLQLVL